jgi:hypothetical protein
MIGLAYECTLSSALILEDLLHQVQGLLVSHTILAVLVEAHQVDATVL